MRLQAGKDVLDVVPANTMRRVPSVFAGALLGSPLTALGEGNFVSSSRPWPSGVRTICDVDSDVVEPGDAVNRTSLDWRLALQLQTKFDKNAIAALRSSNNDADVVHPLDRHVPEHRKSTALGPHARCTEFCDSPPSE